MAPDNTWSDYRDARKIRIAIPNRPVQKLRDLLHVQWLDHEIRTLFRDQFNENYVDNERLSEKWGHPGFAVPLELPDDDDYTQLWMVFNPDQDGRDDYVLVTVYTNEQFEARMRGDYFAGTVSQPMAGRPAVPMEYLVQCVGEQDREFADDQACLAYLSELAKRGRTEQDWKVYKKVKTTVTITE